ncbi:androgen-dependent TFPI-regulating protein-like [Adelges cooleyi]|uniref:androgen-dependent TFPI-regulating protein-like n=1 Tax=Adelges cooleyi TaxID=133065 RepID=UPI0021804E46|nr:androgen-dependent TFPI-regulating protein-like [Adelges cooleyi]
MEIASMKRPSPVMASVLCRSYTEAERQHLFKVSRLFITCYYIYVAYYGLCVLDLDNITNGPFGNLGSNWWWKCVSVWNLILQIAYFIFCTVFIDFADSTLGKTWLKVDLDKNKQIRDFVFLSFVFPVCIYVCLLFWAICAVNKPLLFPDSMNQWIPDWYNHAVHTNPVVLTLYDIVTTKHSIPKMTKSVAGLFALSGSYVTCLLYVKFTTGRWIYLIIGEIAVSMLEVITYFLVTAFIMPFVYLVAGYKLCSWFWDLRITEEENKITKDR